ncbi:MAG: glycosyltransferase family 9 protein, partial [Candidatus Omnitrophota bacterium]
MAAKILFITLSNIGDTVLTLPVLDALRDNFHGARFTVICGAGSRGLFEGDPAVCRVIVYKKHSGPGENIRLFSRLWREKFDVVVDLRNTLFGALLKARHKTSPFLRIPAGLKHMRQRHLYRIRGITGNTAALSRSLLTGPQEEERVRRLLAEGNIKEGDKLVVISAGSRSHTKRWPKERFVELIRMLDQRLGLKTVLVGDAEDSRINRYIEEESQGAALNLGGKTSLRELAVLLKRADCLISNDSAAAHIASYLDVPVAAIFGITDDAKYGPWSSGSVVVKKEISCRPCRKAQCRFGTLECMSLVKVEDVFRAVEKILSGRDGRQKTQDGKNYKRILIARTDRIGDVLLSTPVIRAMREAFPQAYIAMMVSPYARDIVEGNPYLDKVIVLDK